MILFFIRSILVIVALTKRNWCYQVLSSHHQMFQPLEKVTKSLLITSFQKACLLIREYLVTKFDCKRLRYSTHFHTKIQFAHFFLWNGMLNQDYFPILFRLKKKMTKICSIYCYNK